MNGVYIGNRPCKIKKSSWKQRDLEERKKEGKTYVNKLVQVCGASSLLSSDFLTALARFNIRALARSCTSARPALKTPLVMTSGSSASCEEVQSREQQRASLANESFLRLATLPADVYAVLSLVPVAFVEGRLPVDSVLRRSPSSLLHLERKRAAQLSGDERERQGESVVQLLVVWMRRPGGRRRQTRLARNHLFKCPEHARSTLRPLRNGM
jgi:hypothetical protein